MRYWTWPLGFVFPSIVRTTNSSGIHLTFDDGPHPSATPAVLDVLQEQHIRATFFVIGKHAEQFPQLVRRMHAEGHEVGNHTYSHRGLFLQPESVVREEIERNAGVLESILGKRPAYFRPPFGSFGPRSLRVARELKETFTLWSVDSRDFENGKIGEARALAGRIRNGSIVLLHDNEETAQSVRIFLSTLINELRTRGLTFSQHLSN